VRATPELCPIGQLPVHFELKWPNEEGVQFSVLSWGSAATFEQDDFRMPPELPIHKRGELPPFEDYFFSEKARQALFPLTKEKAAPIASPPPQPTADPAALTPPSPVPGPPRNQIVLQNKLSRPLVVMIGRLPYMWLSPGISKEIYLSSAEVRVAARDFLGETIFVERALTAPAKLDFDETEDQSKAAVPGSP
jgi:hypothetical protein